MDAIRRHRLLDFASLAVTLVLLSLGLAMVAWEWRNAHTLRRHTRPMPRTIITLRATLKLHPQKDTNDHNAKSHSGRISS